MQRRPMDRGDLALGASRLRRRPRCAVVSSARVKHTSRRATPTSLLIRFTALSELTVAYQDKPTVVLEGSCGWYDRIREIAYKGKHLDESGSATLHFASTPEEAVDLALRLAADPNAWPKGAEREFQS